MGGAQGPAWPQWLPSSLGKKPRSPPIPAAPLAAALTHHGPDLLCRPWHSPAQIEAAAACACPGTSVGTGATSCCRGHSPGPPPQRRTAQCRKTLLQLDSTPNPGAELLPGATTWALGVTPSPAWGRGFGGSGPNLLLPSAGSWLLLQVLATNAQGNTRHSAICIQGRVLWDGCRNQS